MGLRYTHRVQSQLLAPLSGAEYFGSRGTGRRGSPSYG